MYLAFLLSILLSISQTAQAMPGYTYEKRINAGQILHIVTLNPKDYFVRIIKANDGALGRETVASMAKRSSAEIAINGGFFEMGDLRDGKPTGSLVINGKPYKLKDQVQALFVIHSNTPSILLSKPKKLLKKETSLLSGIPLLLQQGEIPKKIQQNQGEFYTKAHARTAIGVKPDHSLVIVIAEHNYTKDLLTITMGEVQSLMKEKGSALAEKYNHKSPTSITLNQLKEILKEEFTSKLGPKGLTIPELATLMKELGCHNALNLDGGGSSTLWINDSVVNLTLGDIDEAQGMHMQRAVSDAIVFVKR